MSRGLPPMGSLEVTLEMQPLERPTKLHFTVYVAMWDKMPFTRTACKPLVVGSLGYRNPVLGTKPGHCFL